MKQQGFTPLEISRFKRLPCRSPKAKSGSLTGFTPLAGFTLLEILIYCALISVIISGTIGIVYYMLEGSDKLNKAIIVQEEANFILQKIEWALTGVESINSPMPGDSSTVLSINKNNFPSANPIIFDLENYDIRLKRGSSLPRSLNSQNVKAESLNFKHIIFRGKIGIETDLIIDGRKFRSFVYLKK